jgi:hypothetical protein
MFTDFLTRVIPERKLEEEKLHSSVQWQLLFDRFQNDNERILVQLNLRHKLGLVRAQIVTEPCCFLSCHLPNCHIYSTFSCLISEVVLVVDFLMVKIYIQILCHNMAFNFEVTSVTH